jgi:hypothetical protein
VTLSPTVEFGTLKCYADFLTDISPALTHFTALSNDDIVIFWSFFTLNILEKKPALINKKNISVRRQLNLFNAHINQNTLKQIF